jgi:Ca2+-binding RTX toxin-like protein
MAKPIKGGPENDNLIGTEDSETIFGRGGNDTISAWGGNDQAFGDDGNDIVNGGRGSDSLSLAKREMTRLLEKPVTTIFPEARGATCFLAMTETMISTVAQTLTSS